MRRRLNRRKRLLTKPSFCVLPLFDNGEGKNHILVLLNSIIVLLIYLAQIFFFIELYESQRANP